MHRSAIEIHKSEGFAQSLRFMDCYNFGADANRITFGCFAL
jgi:hypothetical protein